MGTGMGMRLLEYPLLGLEWCSVRTSVIYRGVEVKRMWIYLWEKTGRARSF